MGILLISVLVITGTEAISEGLCKKLIKNYFSVFALKHL